MDCKSLSTSITSTPIYTVGAEASSRIKRIFTSSYEYIHKAVSFLFNLIIHCSCSIKSNKDQEGHSKQIGTPSHTSPNIGQQTGPVIRSLIDEKRTIEDRAVSIYTGQDSIREEVRSLCMGLSPPNRFTHKIGPDKTSGSNYLDKFYASLFEKLSRYHPKANGATQTLVNMAHELANRISTTEEYAQHLETRDLLKAYLQDQNEIAPLRRRLLETSPRIVNETQAVFEYRIDKLLGSALKEGFRLLDLSMPDNLITLEITESNQGPNLIVVTLTTHLSSLTPELLTNLTRDIFIPRIDVNLSIFSSSTSWECEEAKSFQNKEFKQGWSTKIFIFTEEHHSQITPHCIDHFSPLFRTSLFEGGLVSSEANDMFDFKEKVSGFFDKFTPQLPLEDRKQIQDDLWRLSYAISLDIFIAAGMKIKPHPLSSLVHFCIEENENGPFFVFRVLLDVDQEEQKKFFTTPLTPTNFGEAFSKCRENLEQHFYIPTPWSIAPKYINDPRRGFVGALTLKLRYPTPSLRLPEHERYSLLVSGSETSLQHLDIGNFDPQSLPPLIQTIMANAYTQRETFPTGKQSFLVSIKSFQHFFEIALLDLRTREEILSENRELREEKFTQFKMNITPFLKQFSTKVQFKLFSKHEMLSGINFEEMEGEEVSTERFQYCARIFRKQSKNLYIL